MFEVNQYFIMNVIWAVLIVVIITLLITSARYLLSHASREKIDYYSFEKKVKLFEVNISPVAQGIYAFVIFGLFIFLLYLGFTPYKELRPYLIPTLIVIILVALTYFIYPILKQMDEDMTEYEANYRKASQALTKKAEAEKAIEDTKQYKAKIISLINDFERQIRTVEDPDKFKLKDSTSIIDQFVDTQTKSVNTYEKDIVERFDKTLEKYFEHKIAIALELPQTNIDFKEEFDRIQNQVFDKYSNLFNSTLYILIDTKKYKTSTIITGGLQILKDNSFSPTQELIQLILLTIDDIEGSPRGLIDYLLNKKIVELEELITYAIDKKILWVFKSNLFETQEQLATISERLITENAYPQSVAFISNYFSRLTDVLAFMDKIKDVNKTMHLFDNYKKVSNVQATFFDESRVLENKVMSLKHFFKGKRIGDDIKVRLNAISNPSKAVYNKDDINTLYEQVQDKYDILRLNTIQGLLMYSGIVNETSLFDLMKTSNLMTDFYNRLLIKDLVVASMLLYALFIKANKDEDLHKEAINALKQTDEYKKMLEGVNLDLPFIEKTKLSNTIITRLLMKQDKKRLANIVLMLEKERLTLDKLAVIS